MATVTPILRTSKINSEGEAPIYIRISDTDKTRYVSLGERIKPKLWLKRDAKVSKRHKRADDINELIRRRIRELEDEIYRQKINGGQPTADELKGFSVKEEKREADFFSFGDTLVADLKKRGKIPLHKRYKSILKKFRTYTGEPLPFSGITPSLLRRFETHMIAKGNKTNTRASAFRGLRAIYNKGIHEGLAFQADYPFRQFKIKRERTPKVRLTFEEIKAVENLELSKESVRWHTRNYFLFSFYAAGMRFRDVASLKWSNIRDREGHRVVDYVMSKTGIHAIIPVVEQNQRILELYASQSDESGFVFPMLKGRDISTPSKFDAAVQSRNTQVNDELKDIASAAEISKKLSFHVARHSFADHARKMGWSVYDISKALRHSTLAQTDRYLEELDERSFKSNMTELFGK